VDPLAHDKSLARTTRTIQLRKLYDEVRWWHACLAGGLGCSLPHRLAASGGGQHPAPLVRR
jgi:hypothetical protein